MRPPLASIVRTVPQTMTMTSNRLRRSALYVPGDNPRALDKIASLACDCVILDLEDAVAPEAKSNARASVVERVARRRLPGKEVVIRVNALDTDAFDADLRAAAGAKPDAILVPKISTIGEVDAVETHLAALSASPEIALWLMIETPRAMLDIAALAVGIAERKTRVAAFVLGLNDLAKAMSITIPAGRASVTPWLLQAALAARVAGVAVLDGVYNNISDRDGLMAECAQARSLGYDGKTLIHPSQIDTANATLVPSSEEIRQARMIVAAFADPQNRAAGVIKLDGEMVERLHLHAAEALLARAEAAGL